MTDHQHYSECVFDEHGWTCVPNGTKTQRWADGVACGHGTTKDDCEWCNPQNPVTTMGAGNVARDDTETLVFADESETCTRDPYCTVHPDEDCPSAFDPGPVPPEHVSPYADMVRPETAAALDALQSLTADEKRLVLDYVAGYAPDAILSGAEVMRQRRAVAMLEA